MISVGQVYFNKDDNTYIRVNKIINNTVYYSVKYDGDVVYHSHKDFFVIDIEHFILHLSIAEYIQYSKAARILFGKNNEST